MLDANLDKQQERDHKDARRYNDLMNANAQVVQDNIKYSEIFPIIKRLKKKRIEELVDEANYDEMLEEPECQKVLMMNSTYYCDCGYCSEGYYLQRILDGKG